MQLHAGCTNGFQGQGNPAPRRDIWSEKYSIFFFSLFFLSFFFKQLSSTEVIQESGNSAVLGEYSSEADPFSPRGSLENRDCFFVASIITLTFLEQSKMGAYINAV